MSDLIASPLTIEYDTKISATEQNMSSPSIGKSTNASRCNDNHSVTASESSESSATKLESSFPISSNISPPACSESAAKIQGETIGKMFLATTSATTTPTPTNVNASGSSTKAPPATKRSKKRKHPWPSKESQTTTTMAMDKMMIFMKAQAKFSDAITVRNREAQIEYSESPTFTNMSLSIRRQHWTQCQGGKPYSGNSTLTQPELVVVGTSKSRVLDDILELFHHLEKDSNYDKVRLGKTINFNVAFSAFNFISRLLIENAYDRFGSDCKMKLFLKSMVERFGAATDEQNSSTKNMVPPEEKMDLAVQHGRQQTDDGTKKTSIKWCLSDDGLMCNSIDKYCKEILKNRKTKKESRIQETGL